jgi:hypothetical protein
MVNRVALGRCLVACSVLLLPLLAGAGPGEGTQQSAWSRSYVVEWYEPAFYYGANEGTNAAGTDCPAGTVPEMDWRKVLKTSYRTDAEVEKILDPENPQRARVGGIRGPNRENVYEKPWAVPDPGLRPVTGDRAFGFDLDGDAKTGFKGLDVAGQPNGSRGIDNEYYRAVGCLMAWRGPTREGHHAKYVNDGMRDGRYTLVMIISGDGPDWRNDPNVRVGFFSSRDKMVKDANGAIAHDYTFRITPDPKYQSVVAARTRDGVIETAQPVEIVTRSLDRLPLVLKDGRLRFEIQPDGALVGIIGGYRNIDDYYSEWAAGGSIFELTMHINIPAYWYALQRSADGLFDPALGRYTGISSAYRVYAKPAFVVSANGREHLTAAQLPSDAAPEQLAAAPMQRAESEAPPAQAGQQGQGQGRGFDGPGRRALRLDSPPPDQLPPQSKAPPRNFARVQSRAER